MPDGSGGDWVSKFGGAAGLAALAGVILDKMRTWKKDDSDTAIKVDELNDKHSQAVIERYKTYSESLERRNKELTEEIELVRSKARNTDSAAGFVARENTEQRALLYQVLTFCKRGLTLPPDIITELQKYEDF